MLTTPSEELEHDLEAHRRELTGYCYRMLGSGFEAEDAVQETMVRAWRAARPLRGRAPRCASWLYRIATNVCLDMLQGPQRRARPMDLGPSSTADALLGAATAREHLGPARWPTAASLPTDGDPAERRRARARRSGWRSSPRSSTCRPGSAPC